MTNDRKLGNEWKGWHNKLRIQDIDASTQKRVYFAILFLCLLMLGCVFAFSLYLTAPRLNQFWQYLPLTVGILLSLTWLICFVLYLLIMFTVLFGKKIIIFKYNVKNLLLKSFSWVFRLGMNLGINRDRVSNSIIKVSNALINIHHDPITPAQLIVLLPRCLKKEILAEIKSYCSHRGIKVFVVGGGSKAREIVKTEKPKGIIGVACERDLLSGIQDVILHVPVLGIPNTRPEGPCKNTLIRMSDLIMAVQCFLGSSA